MGWVETAFQRSWSSQLLETYPSWGMSVKVIAFLVHASFSRTKSGVYLMSERWSVTLNGRVNSSRSLSVTLV